MIDLGTQLVKYGVGFVFGNVLVEQAGLPIPAVPVMVVAGALAADGKLSPWALLGAATAAAVIADSLWFSLGRWQGRRVLKTVCKIAVSPDSCVRSMERLYERYGLRSLLFCKFVPGFSTVAPTLAGALRAPRWRFQLFDAMGAAIWACAAIGTGALFHRALDRVLAVLDGMGSLALAVLAAALAAYVGWRFEQRRRFLRELRMARVSAEELAGLLAGPEPPLVVDVRTPGGLRVDPRHIPGSLLLSWEEIEERMAELPRARELVLYCT
jgi:membrane protein DedA with SNARE-associated domain